MIKKSKLLVGFLSLGIISTTYMACSDTDDIDDNIVTELHPAFDEFDADRVQVSISNDGTQYSITASGQPNHVTEYYPVGHALHIDENIQHTGANAPIPDPTYIEEDYVVTIDVDATPDLTGSSVATGLGSIGVAVSGAYIFNNYEGMNVLSTTTAGSLDWAGAHIGGSPNGVTGPYHYHLEPTPISSDDDNLIGILLDGVFIYGRRDYPSNAYPTDLDASGGHFGPTPHNPDGEYHYHIINEQFFTGTETYIVFEGPYMGY
jgi:hypothetical protein